MACSARSGRCWCAGTRPNRRRVIRASTDSSPTVSTPRGAHDRGEALGTEQGRGWGLGEFPTRTRIRLTHGEHGSLCPVAGMPFGLDTEDLQAHPALGTPDYVDDFVAFGQVWDSRAIRAFFSELLVALPGFQITVDRIVADDTSRSNGSHWHVHRGLFQGVLPTGCRAQIREGAS